MLYVSLEINDKYKKIFDYTNGEKVPLIIINLKELWKKLLKNCITFKGFNFIEQYKEIESEIKLEQLITVSFFEIVGILTQKSRNWIQKDLNNPKNIL